MKEGKGEGRKAPRQAKRTKKPADPGGGEIALPDGDRPPDPVGGKSDRSRSAVKGSIEDQREDLIGPEAKPGGVPPSDEVLRDIVRKAKEGDIEYQKLYLKYIDLISQETTEGDEVIYEATFVDDKDKDT